MQNEREKQGGGFFALIQKLNFIFADESFNEMNIFYSALSHGLETTLLIIRRTDKERSSLKNY
jgi:hypothetical protein